MNHPLFGFVCMIVWDSCWWWYHCNAILYDIGRIISNQVYKQGEILFLFCDVCLQRKMSHDPKKATAPPPWVYQFFALSQVHRIWMWFFICSKKILFWVIALLFIITYNFFNPKCQGDPHYYDWNFSGNKKDCWGFCCYVQGSRLLTKR